MKALIKNRMIHSETERGRGRFLATCCLILVAMLLMPDSAHSASERECFESREGYSKVVQREIGDDRVNIKCSNKTGAVLWWGDPYNKTVDMGPMPVEADYSHEEAVIKERTPQLKYYMPCTVCHNGVTVPYPKDKNPRQITMHLDIVGEDSMDLKHGRLAIWCLDCHNATNRDTLISHRGEEISFNQPMRLCGKCHGQIYSDWRDGIHGKRIGNWTKGGKKRWWVCTECHNPHSVQLRRFQPIKPERAPALPKGMESAEHDDIQYEGGPGGHH
ncbi:MAG: hypothetical protein GY721_10580 [Deltaproteobacteria bacterium]|nr:hypothetical protein [Deltaproteobacteria bacterium]